MGEKRLFTVVLFTAAGLLWQVGSQQNESIALNPSVRATNIGSIIPCPELGKLPRSSFSLSEVSCRLEINSFPLLPKPTNTVVSTHLSSLIFTPHTNANGPAFSDNPSLVMVSAKTAIAVIIGVATSGLVHLISGHLTLIALIQLAACVSADMSLSTGVPGSIATMQPDELFTLLSVTSFTESSVMTTESSLMTSSTESSLMTSSTIGATLPPSSSSAIGATLPSSSSSAIGATLPPSSSSAIGATLPSSSSSAIGATLSPSSSSAIGATLPPSSSSAIGATLPPSSSSAIGATLPLQSTPSANFRSTDSIGFISSSSVTPHLGAQSTSTAGGVMVTTPHGNTAATSSAITQSTSGVSRVGSPTPMATHTPPCTSPGCGAVSCMANNDTTWNIFWPPSPPNAHVVRPCPGGTQNAIRDCFVNGTWSVADISLCEKLGDLKDMAEKIFSNSSASVFTILKLVNNLANLTTANSSSLYAQDLITSNYIITKTLDAIRNSSELPALSETSVIVTVLDNQLSDVNMPAWQVLAKMNNNGSEVLLRNIEQCAFYLSSYNNASVSLWKPSIVMQAMRVNVTSMSEDVDFPSKEVALMSSFPLTASIRTPVALLKERANRNGIVQIAQSVVRNIGQLLPSKGTQYIGSLVISSQISFSNGISSSSLTNLSFMVSPEGDSFTAACFYWDFITSAWSSKGITETVTDKRNVKCSSSHLTSFAVLLQTTQHQGPSYVPAPIPLISFIGCGVSLFFLTVTFIFLRCCKKNPNTLRNFVPVNIIAGLAITLVIFLGGIRLDEQNETACKTASSLIQYFWLSALSWMMCTAILLCLMLVCSFKHLKGRHWVFVSIGWGLPLPIVLFGLILWHKYYFIPNGSGQNLYCWISTDDGIVWIFAGPALGIFVITLFLLSVAFFAFRRSSSLRKKILQDTHDLNTFKWLLTTTSIILPLMGGAILFAFINVDLKFQSLAVECVFGSFISLQGFLVFILFVLLDEEVCKDRTKLMRELKTAGTRKRNSLAQIEQHLNIIPEESGAEMLTISNKSAEP